MKKSMRMARFAGPVFRAVACGGSTDGKEVSKSSSSTFGAPTSGEGGGGGVNGDTQTQNVSCEDACTNTIDWCGTQLGTYAECVASCPEMGQSLLNCMGSGDHCEAITGCVEGTGDPGDDGTPSTNNANTPPDDAIGASCFSDLDCQSGYCRKPNGASDGVCEVNDFGESCRTDDDCNGSCIYRNAEDDDFGQCTYTCDSFSDCPSFWQCRELGNGAASVCWDD